jgi:hypothetical protein
MEKGNNRSENNIFQSDELEETVLNYRLRFINNISFINHLISLAELPKCEPGKIKKDKLSGMINRIK